MGSAMAGCLQDAGHPLTVIANRSRKGVDAAVARGATEVGTGREIAAASDIVMLCMDTSDNVEARMTGADGVLAGLQKGAVVIDFGTSRPASTRMLAEKTAQAGGHFLDAPLGRTPAHAKDGKLNIMCAGDKGAYDRVKPVLDTLGENVFHLGESGTGHTIKLINNFFAMTTATAMAEAFAMADAAGVDREKLYSVMAAGPLHSGMMDFVRNYAMEGQIDLAFSLANGRKDVGYFAAMADHLGQETRIGPATLAALSEAVESGWGDRMVPEIVDYFSKGKPK
jgi:2-hydroxy-3-oxopropionate reductase